MTPHWTALLTVAASFVPLAAPDAPQAERLLSKETFDVTLNVDISNGKILSARMENPVTKVTRACSDGALTQCGDAQATPTLRRIELSLLREQSDPHHRFNRSVRSCAGRQSASMLPA